jgi:pyruvate dehydrogenase E2 component (dihydrolipoamide acetyltransferase)
MPSLGADMDHGTVTRWLVKPGDTVHRGDIVAVVDTDKADVEVEVFEDGVVQELLVPEGTEVEVGTPLARIGDGDRAPTVPTASTRLPTEAVAARTPEIGPTAVPSERSRHVSPVLRHRAKELGVDLAAVTGTGPGGGITRADVERAARPGTAAPDGHPRTSPRARRLAEARGVDVAALTGSGPGGAVVGSDVEQAGPADRVSPTRPDKNAGMRAAIARAMARSKREIPHYYLASDIDFSRARAFLEERNAARPVAERLLSAVLLLKATAVGVREVPELNGFWVDDEHRPSDAVHVGMAISLRGGGLVAPAIHDADQRSLDDLMAAFRDLVARARAGSLRASEMSDPTITVTSLGEQGVQVVHGVIYPPQVAIVGFGAILERPWAVDGMVGAHPIVTATVAADHRASDGARGARLLNVIGRLLQDPASL